jgi:hypothetical protein
MGQYYKATSIDKMESLLAHDYDNGLKLMEHSYIGNNFMKIVEKLLSKGNSWYKTRIVWAGDYADEEANSGGHNLYGMCKEIKAQKSKQEFMYIINHSKKVYIDKSEIGGFKEHCVVWKIHPLPLLTNESNGRGGGDFIGSDKRIGTWARDIISVSNVIPQGYEKVDGTFIEKY